MLQFGVQGLCGAYQFVGLCVDWQSVQVFLVGDQAYTLVAEVVVDVAQGRVQQDLRVGFDTGEHLLCKRLVLGMLLVGVKHAT